MRRPESPTAFAAVPARAVRAAAAAAGLLLAVVATGCSDEPEGSAATVTPIEQELPVVLRHDFGAIPHGQKGTHTFEVSLAKPLLPLAFVGDCSCSTYRLQIRDRNGNLRPVSGRPQPSEVVQQGEQLLFELTIDTATKEAVDAPLAQSRGRLVFGEPDKVLQRSSIPVLFSFAIDAPVRLVPTARISFGALARCQSFSQTLQLHGDVPGRTVRFGPARCSEPHVRTELREEEGVTRLTVRYDPERGQPLGSVMAVVEVDTDLPDDYVVRIPVSGQLIPDIEVRPIDKISFGAFDFAEPTEQSVLIVDHDRSRPPGFRVTSIVDEKGVSIADHFAPELLPDPADPRTTRVVLRYLGGLTGKWFRGTLTLAKSEAEANAGGNEAAGPPPAPVVVRIELVGFHRPH